MNRKLLLIFLIFILIACKKDRLEQFPDYILAGQIDGLGIVYIDFEPDENLVSVPPNYYAIKLKLDLNKDSIDDFEIIFDDTNRMSCCSRLEAFVTPLNDNSICVLKDESNIVAPLIINDTISKNRIWSNSKAYLFNYWYARHTTPDGSVLIQTDLDGYWYNTDEFFVGVKIKNNDDELYGWIDVNLKDVTGIHSGVVRRFSVTKAY